MKINAVRAMLIVSLLIILLYILGLFLPIINNTKNSKIYLKDPIISDTLPSTQGKAYHKHVL